MNIISAIKKYKTFAQIALFLAAAYAVIWFIAEIIGDYRTFHGFDLWEFGEKYAGNALLGVSIFVFKILLRMAWPFLWVMWIFFILKDKSSIRIPVIVTFAYYVCNLAYYLIITGIGSDSFLAYLRNHFLTFMVMIAWLILLIGKSENHKMIFIILRYFVLGVNAVLNTYYFYRVMSNRIELGTKFYPMDFVGFADMIFQTAIMALFILWIYRPNLFLRSSMQEEIK